MVDYETLWWAFITSYGVITIGTRSIGGLQKWPMGELELEEIELLRTRIEAST